MALSANERRIVELVLKATGDAELKRISAELRATREAAVTSQKALTGMSTGLGTAAKFASGFIGALGVQTIIGWGRAILDAADSLDAAAEQAGIGVERYQRLKEAFRELEVDSAKFETGMERLSATLSDTLAGGTGKAQDALKQLGIASKIYSGEIRTTDELVDALAASQAAMNDDMKFTALIVDILGRKLGVDYAAALKNGNLQTTEAAQAMEGFTGVTEDQIKVLADANEAFDSFRTHATAAVLGFAADAIAGFKAVGHWIALTADEVSKRGLWGAGIRAFDRQSAEFQRDIEQRLARSDPNAWWNTDPTDRTPVTPPTTPAHPARGGGGESPAARAAREQAAEDLKNYNDQLEREEELILKVNQANDDAAKALQDWANGLERAADPMIDLNAQMDKLIAGQEKLSDGAFATEWKRLRDAMNEARNAAAENSEEWAAHDKALNAARDATEDFGDSWRYAADAVGQATYDIIAGTTSVSQAVRQMVGTILSEIARIAAIKLAAQIVTALFGATGAGKSAGMGGTGDLKLFANAKGNIISGPTMFGMGGGIGIAGEAGAEVIAPLRRDAGGNMGVGAVAPRVIVNNFAGADVGVTQTGDGVQIDIVRRAIANDIRRGGNPVSAAIEGTYRVGRQAQAFG